jgi:hypothetical protein
VSEAVVREYFEQLGYLVNQPSKHLASGRRKTVEEEVDLVVVHPGIAEQSLPEHLVWTTDDLARVARAVVAVRGWHTDRFYAGTIEQTPEVLRFVEPGALRFAGKRLGSASFARILCLPRLPASGALKERTIAALRAKGVHGIISFQTILAALVAAVEENRNYDRSDLLQVIRLLKIYGFLRGTQMELFAGRRGARRKPRAQPAAAE